MTHEPASATGDRHDGGEHLPLRVLIVEHNPSGGMYQYAHRLADAMVELGSSVVLVTGRDPELPAERPGLRVMPILPTWHVDGTQPTSTLWRRIRRAWRAAKAVRAWMLTYRVAARSDPDVVQFNHLPRALDGLFASLIMRRLPTAVGAIVAHTPRPLSWRGGGGGLHMRMSRTYRRATGAAYHRADVVFVLGERSQRELEETWPGVRRIVQIPHGSGPSLEARSVPTADAAPPCVLFFGTWARYKGLDLLLDAFEIVRRSRPDAQLVVAGGVTKDTDLDAVAKAARRIGGVDLRPGYVPSQDVSRLFESARVVALPYSIANYSGVADLAHAHARPVVMTDVGDLRQAVASGGGVVVPPDDPDRFAAALVSMLNDPARAASEGNRGQARVANAWTRTAEHFMAAYRPLADDARSAAVSL